MCLRFCLQEKQRFAAPVQKLTQTSGFWLVLPASGLPSGAHALPPAAGGGFCGHIMRGCDGTEDRSRREGEHEAHFLCNSCNVTPTSTFRLDYSQEESRWAHAWSKMRNKTTRIKTFLILMRRLKSVGKAQRRHSAHIFFICQWNVGFHFDPLIYW